MYGKHREYAVYSVWMASIVACAAVGLGGLPSCGDALATRTPTVPSVDTLGIIPPGPAVKDRDAGVEGRNEVIRMATTLWTGAVSQDYDDLNNWSNGVPAANDTAIFPNTTTVPCTPGATQNAIQLTKLHIAKDATYNIGGPGNPLIIGAHTLIHQGTGTLYFQPSTVTETGDYTTDPDYVVLVDSDNLVNAMYVSGSGRFRRMRVIKGGVETSGTTLMTLVEVGYRDNPLTDVNLTLGYSATTLQIGGGQTTTTMTFTNIAVYQGHVTYNGTNPATIDMFGGTLIANTITGMTTLNAVGGSISFENNPNPVTIVNLYEWSDAEVIGSSLLSITNRYRMDGDYTD